jgi:hypothetical protein
LIFIHLQFINVGDSTTALVHMYIWAGKPTGNDLFPIIFCIKSLNLAFRREGLEGGDGRHSIDGWADELHRSCLELGTLRGRCDGWIKRIQIEQHLLA